jgi:hypothetical protein
MTFASGWRFQSPRSSELLYIEREAATQTYTAYSYITVGLYDRKPSNPTSPPHFGSPPQVHITQNPCPPPTANRKSKEMSEFNYSKILLIGATSGIGHALAEKILLSRPSAKLIVVGRRQERLDEFVQKWGEERVEGVAFDVTDLGGIEGFARK